MPLDDTYYGSYVRDIFITEAVISEPHKVLGKVQAGSTRMNSNLAEIKQKLATSAKRMGADAIISYTYGQKRTLLSFWDDTKWHTEGVAIKLSDTPH